MAKTLASLRTGVRVYLDESAQTDFLDTEVDRAINYRYHDVVSEVMEVYEEYYLTTTPIPITTVANQQEYSLDSTILKVERAEINYKPSDTNSTPIRSIPIKIEELRRYLNSAEVGGSGLFSSGYYVIGAQSAQKIGFVPKPTEGGVAAANVWGLVAPSDMTQDTDPVLIPYPDRFGSLVELGAAADLLRKGQQEEGPAARYLQEYVVGIARMKTFLRERQADGVVMITDALMEDIAFDNPL